MKNVNVLVSENFPDEIGEINAANVSVSIEQMSDDMIWLSVGDDHFCISTRKRGVAIIRRSTEEYPVIKEKKKKKKAKGATGVIMDSDD